jgi:hypothetical protein
VSGEAVPAIARTEIFLRSRKASRLLAGAAAQHGATAIMLLGAGFDGLDTGRGPRRLRLDVAGIDIRVWPFRRARVAWSAIAAITRVPAGLRVELRDGSERVLRLGDLDNRADVEAAILGAAAVGLLPDPESPLAS